MKKLSIALCLLITTHPVTYAADSTSEAKGDAQAGKAKSTLCAACHGATGHSLAPIWPNLAGQHESYIVQQLKNFKSGARNEPTMVPMAMPLTEQDMLDLAAYFSSQTVELGSVKEESLELGQKIYRGGNKETGVSACIACHGPTGAGNPAAEYPSVSGQKPEYNLKQLKDYASEVRKPQGQAATMRDIASNMTEEEMKAVTDYMYGLH
jgi:cytochrome c553